MACGGSSSSSSGSCGKSKSSSGGCGAPAPSCGGGCEPSVQEECCAPIPPAEPFSVPAAPRAKKSAMEKKVLCAKCPVEASGEEICVNGFKGIYVNKDEVDAFSGPVPIDCYEIFNDPNPKVINKTLSGEDNVQEVKVKFLVAPAGPAPGDIVIRERPGVPAGPAPPVIIRQEAAAGCTGKPQCYRECPPKPCPKICPQLIEVCAGPGTPPPRKVIIEKMPAGGSKPGPIYAERWLSAASCQTRNVVFEPAPQAPSCNKVRNVIINWTRAEGSTSTNVSTSGPKCTDPRAYKRKYGKSLSKNLPEVVKAVPPPPGTKIAGTPQCDTPQLTGCVSALKRVNLAEHGLEAYADQVANA